MDSFRPRCMRFSRFIFPVVHKMGVEGAIFNHTVGTASAMRRAFRPAGRGHPPPTEKGAAPTYRRRALHFSTGEIPLSQPGLS